MTCRELTDFLADYLDGELPEPRRRVFEQHLAQCPDCRNYLDSYRRTVEVAKAAYGSDDDAAAPADVPPALLRAVVEAMRKK